MANSYVQVPPDGAGKKIYTNQQVVSGQTVQIQGVNVVSGDDATKSMNVDYRGTIYTRFFEGDPIISSYGDLKIINEHILGVYEHTIDSYDDLFTIDEISGGTSTFVSNESSTLLTVTNEPGSRVTRTTNRYHYYQPGISFLIILSASCGDSGKLNNKRQWGLFGNSYGLFFELSGTTINVVLRENSSGPVINHTFPQSDWNRDKLDGTGGSGVDLDVTKAYQYFININYPNNGFIFGVYDSDKGRIACHEIHISGLYNYPLIKHINLPIKFNNENIGVTDSSSELREIMAVVKTEGEADYTFWRFGDLGVENKAVTRNTPVLNLRAKILLDNGRYNRINSLPETLSVYSTGSTIKISFVSHNASLTGDTWTLNSIGGPMEADITATNIDINDDTFWILTTFYVQKDQATNIDLRPYFELNDEGMLLASSNLQTNIYSFVATAIGGSVANVTMDLSYRSMY
jgi:hypothetical protein